MATGSVRFDLPTIEDETREFWEAARRGKLLLRSCNRCGVVHYYPRPFCPECWSDEVTWIEASGRARLYTHSTVHVNDLPPFDEQVPYIAAVVDLEEGPRMMTQIVDCDPGELEIGMPLELTFRHVSDEVAVAVFRPSAR
ncbi:MAG: Zn-ribbon domain-containing OB-fold protein [Acidimicrobiales bacterium]|nr:Zn-ribbon domain-containing OB-fold protein [Acidimicrobiales bacterium]